MSTTLKPPFSDKFCQCGKDAELCHYAPPRISFWCWTCFGKPTSYLEERANHYRSEAKHMGASVKHAWEMVAVANQRLAAAGLTPVSGPREAP